MLVKFSPPPLNLFFFFLEKRVSKNRFFKKHKFVDDNFFYCFSGRASATVRLPLRTETLHSDAEGYSNSAALRRQRGPSVPFNTPSRIHIHIYII